MEKPRCGYCKGTPLMVDKGVAFQCPQCERMMPKQERKPYTKKSAKNTQ